LILNTSSADMFPTFMSSGFSSKCFFLLIFHRVWNNVSISISSAISLAVSNACRKHVSLYSLKKEISPYTFSIATSISISFICKCLPTKFTAYSASYQMIIATINSYSPSSLFANPLASLLVMSSLSVSYTWNFKKMCYNCRYPRNYNIREIWKYWHLK
jgi:hypothetical protein